MNNRRSAVVSVTLACALSAPLALGVSSARADEVSDLRANQELLQRRIDQLAQAQVPGNPFGVGGPPGPTTVQTMGGSFPRSFLIPGTDTSLRIGGEIRENLLYWINGGNPNGGHNTNAGQTGQLNNIPLSHSGAAVARGHSIFIQSPQQSKLNFETRTPTAWGEARSFIEFDFSNQPVAQGNRTFAISDNISLRLRYAYGTLGGFLAGQANSNFADSDASMETISFSGLVGDSGHSRIPQVRYTQPLAPWGVIGALSFSLEQPETEFWSPLTGVTGAFPAPAAVAGNPLKAASPDLTAAWYIPQPWGHMDFSAAVRPTLQIKDGVNIDRTYTGFGGHFSGDVKPGWFGWDKDDITWQFTAGESIGPFIGAGNGNGTIGLVSNYTTGITRGNLLVKPVFSWGGTVGYRHDWTPKLRSNFGFGIYHEDINTLNGVVCAGGASAAQTTARNTGAAGCGLNKELVSAAANIFYAPVSFVDIGFEYFWGHRLTVGNAKGDENVLESRFRVRF